MNTIAILDVKPENSICIGYISGLPLETWLKPGEIPVRFGNGFNLYRELPARK